MGGKGMRICTKYSENSQTKIYDSQAYGVFLVLLPLQIVIYGLQCAY